MLYTCLVVPNALKNYVNTVSFVRQLTIRRFSCWLRFIHLVYPQFHIDSSGSIQRMSWFFCIKFSVAWIFTDCMQPPCQVQRKHLMGPLTVTMVSQSTRSASQSMTNLPIDWNVCNAHSGMATSILLLRLVVVLSCEHILTLQTHILPVSLDEWHRKSMRTIWFKVKTTHANIVSTLAQVNVFFFKYFIKQFELWACTSELRVISFTAFDKKYCKESLETLLLKNSSIWRKKNVHYLAHLSYSSNKNVHEWFWLSTEWIRLPSCQAGLCYDVQMASNWHISQYSWICAHNDRCRRHRSERKPPNSSD